LWNVSGLEAVYRDYAPKGVKFFFIYKSLAHPELVGNYVQPFTLKERLAHAKQAEKELGATIPWLVDDLDNRFKHAMGDRPNSEFIIDPKGKIVRKRPWSNPPKVRKDLEELVGKVDKITKEEDIKLKLELPLKAPKERNVTERLKRPRMQPIVMEPKIEPKGPPFYAKLRVEAEAELIRNGVGQMYLGFHLDPFHGAHWNNLTPPLRYKLDLPQGVKIAKATGEAAKVAVASDCDPREFLLDVAEWSTDKPITLTVTYSACTDDACHVVKQEYTIYMKRDQDGGGARGVGAGFWEPATFAKQQLSRDKNSDGKLSKDEVSGLVQPHFEHFDTNKDGFLGLEELKAVGLWLNEHHKPGAMEKPKK
jgi:hypothetical protein